MVKDQSRMIIMQGIKIVGIYPDKEKRGGCPIKTVHFAFPVSYNGKTVYDVSPPYFDNEETVVLMSRA